MKRARSLDSRRGVGLVETLIALAIGGLVLSLAGAFFGQQARVTRETQSRNEINIRARAVGEALLQDLRMAGARAVVDAEGTVAFRSALPCDPDPLSGVPNECVTVRPASGGTGVDLVEVYYVSSLFLADDGVTATNACRRVTYELDGTTLHRSDVECASGPDSRTFATEFATDVTALTVQFMCSDAGTPTTDPQSCYASEGGFMRESQVAVEVGSARDQRLALRFESAASMLNMRAPDRFVEGP
jgi:type II secretory pathway component PulJ